MTSTKGSMALIDEARAELLYAAMGPGKVISGGSAANTIAGLASFGGKGGFIGKVKADELGAHLSPRPDLARRRLRHAGRDGRPGDGPLLHHRHARWRAHDEHLSRRLPGSVRRRCRRSRDRECRHHLSRRLSLGSAGGQGRLPQGLRDRPQGRRARRHHPVGFLLRRSLPRRVPRPDPQRHGRYRLRQRA